MRIVRFTCLLIAGLISVSSFACPKVQIRGDVCDENITLIAHAVPVSSVLQELSDHLQFTLDVNLPRDRMIHMERTAPARQLLQELLVGENLMFTEAPQGACNKPRILRVWVLGQGEDVPRLVYEPRRPQPELQPLAQSDEPVYAEPPPPRGTRHSMSEAEWQQIKQDYREGRIVGDPETGKPIPADDLRARQPDPEK